MNHESAYDDKERHWIFGPVSEHSRFGIPDTHLKMETWLEDVKRVHIPRPKFGSGSRGYGCGYPTEPPKDYTNEESRDDFKLRNTAGMAKATEEIRRALQKL